MPKTASNLSRTLQVYFYNLTFSQIYMNFCINTDKITVEYCTLWHGPFAWDWCAAWPHSVQQDKSTWRLQQCQISVNISKCLRLIFGISLAQTSSKQFTNQHVLHCLYIKTFSKPSLTISHFLYLATYFSDICSLWATPTTFLVDYSSYLYPIHKSASPRSAKQKCLPLDLLFRGSGEKVGRWGWEGEELAYVC